MNRSEEAQADYSIEKSSENKKKSNKVENNKLGQNLGQVH